MKKHYYLLALVILFLLLFITNVLVNFQEGNPLPILLGIIMVEFSRGDNITEQTQCRGNHLANCFALCYNIVAVKNSNDVGA